LVLALLGFPELLVRLLEIGEILFDGFFALILGQRLVFRDLCQELFCFGGVRLEIINILGLLFLEETQNILFLGF